MTANRRANREPWAPRRIRRLWAAIAAVLGFCTPVGEAAAQREYAVVPKTGTDHTAHRIDADVFGWNTDFSEIGAAGMDLHRDRDGQHRGEIFLLVFDVGSTVPKATHFLLNVTQVANPSNPLPLLDVRDRLWAAGYDMINIWHRRPKRKHYAGAMFIDTVWDSVEVSPGICQPWVGFMLTYKGQLRYQRHEPLRLHATCEDLRLTDERLYWGKRDLGVALIRFDHSAAGNDYNEKSVRFTISAAWRLAEPIHIVLQSARPRRHPETKHALETLRGFGKVTVEHTPPHRGPGMRIGFLPQYQHMARRMAEDFNGSLDADMVMPDGAHVLVRLGLAQQATVSSPAPPRHHPGRQAPQQPQGQSDANPGGADGEGTYLDDWSLSQ